MADAIEVVAYDGEWVEWFQQTANKLHTVLGDVAVRIDHVGSTAVPGLDAKPVLDIQVSVQDLEPMEQYADPLTELGYRYRPNEDLTKRYFREPPGARRTHIHVRQAGSFHEQVTLLFRDYLRKHPQTAAEYGKLKHRLAEEFRRDRIGYVDAKSDFVWATIQSASEWAQLTGWRA